MLNAPLRAAIYEQLAEVFDGTATRFRGLSAERAGAPGIIDAAIDALDRALESARPEDLAADHTRLFVNARGGVAAPPYASWYLDGRLLGPSTAWVQAAYAAQGLEPERSAGEPPDYIGAELEFMCFLARHETAARTTHDEGALRIVLAAQAAFAIQHLARWVPPFIARVRAATPHPVFEAAIGLLDTVLDEDRRGLSTAISKSAANDASR